MGFLKFILVILVIYVAIRLVARFFGKAILLWLGKKAMERVQRNMQTRGDFSENPFGNQQQKQQTQKKSSQPLEKKTVGEYIDFEEID